LFRRKKAADVEAETDLDESGATDDAASGDEIDEHAAALAAEDEAEEAARARWRVAERRRQRQGPHDISEVDDDAERVDLGALQLPVVGQMQLRLGVDQQTQIVRSVSVLLGDSAVEIAAFAAPRTDGIWDGIREGIGAEITKLGGTADVTSGTFGEEILARIPVQDPSGRTALEARRFIGVDGPRWFLRAMVTGAAAHDRTKAVAVEEVIRSCVVFRDGEARVPREPLPLKLPVAAVPESAPDQPADDLKPFDRGPEISEVR
jgi:hypothetical protein